MRRRQAQAPREHGTRWRAGGNRTAASVGERWRWLRLVGGSEFSEGASELLARGVGVSRLLRPFALDWGNEGIIPNKR